VATPLLRKDFVVSEYQLLEERAASATRCCSSSRRCRNTTSFHCSVARSLGLDTLVEVHDDQDWRGRSTWGGRNRRQQSQSANAGRGRRSVGAADREDAWHVVAVSERD
jgi:hypothetical protein